MKVRLLKWGMCLSIGFLLNAAAAIAGEDTRALLDLMVKKGMITQEEAGDVAAEISKDEEQNISASKIKINQGIQSVELFGDVRLRYEMREGATPAGATGSGGALLGHNDSETMNRWRYRLRFGIRGDLYDNFFYGIRAATNPNYDRSGNVTFGHSDAAGPFGKDQSLIALDMVYLGWHATSDLTLIGGQMPNPLYTTNLVWDDNLNPAGAAEQWKHDFGDYEVFATAGQFVYQAASGNGITNTIGGSSDFDNTFMYVEEVGFKYKFDENTSFKAAAAFYSYSGTQGTSATSVAGLYSTSPLNLAAPNQSPSFFNGPFVGAASAPTTNVSGINDLAILEFPMEFDFKAWNIPMRFFGDFAYNLEASQRANAARGAIDGITGNASTGNVGVTGAGTIAGNNALVNSPSFQGVLHSGKGLLDQAAYQVGYEIGQLKKKGDWDGKIYWQSTGYYAVDPNLVDADIFNAATNMQGAVVSLAYNWTDGVSSTIRYGYAMQVNDQLATPNVNQDLQLGTIQHYSLLQLDLMWKF